MLLIVLTHINTDTDSYFFFFDPFYYTHYMYIQTQRSYGAMKQSKGERKKPQVYHFSMPLHSSVPVFLSLLFLSLFLTSPIPAPHHSHLVLCASRLFSFFCQFSSFHCMCIIRILFQPFKHHTNNPCYLQDFFKLVQQEIIDENDFLLILFNVCIFTINNPSTGRFSTKGHSFV